MKRRHTVIRRYVHLYDPGLERVSCKVLTAQFGSLMMRSQLDCQDERLPGSGVFDIKTRACLPIRHDRANHAVCLPMSAFTVVALPGWLTPCQENSVYAIIKDKGSRLSFEKEYYDIVRAGMLKWR